MGYKMYIYAFSNHQEVVFEQLSDKKKLLKTRVNRADNFVNLTLLGIEKCLQNIVLKKETHLYISSKDGNINSTIKILEAIFRKKQLPMPFNFLNSVNASILFFVAKNFGLEGKGIFTDSFDSALLQAYVDVKNGKTVLIGRVNEAIADLDLHRKKFKVQEITEQSQWLVLSPKQEGENALAQISDVKIKTSEQATKHSTNDLFDFLEDNNSQSSYPFNCKHLSFVVRKC